jgi:hypothetical protein
MSSDPNSERTVGAGDTLRAEPLQVAGQLNLAGEAQVAPADLSADGTAEAEARRALPVAADEETTIAAGTRRVGSPVEIAGQLNIAGQLEVTPAAALSAERSIAASGSFDATGTGTLDAERALAAAGTAEAVGEADAVVTIPIIRRDESSLAWQEDEEIELGSDSPAP